MGLFFSLGCLTTLGWHRGMLPPIATIAVLVAFNCLVIAARDAEVDSASGDTGAASAWWLSIRRDVGWLALPVLVIAAVPGLCGHPGFSVAGLLSGVLLWLLHRRALRIGEDDVRALADFCLLTPGWSTLGWVNGSGTGGRAARFGVRPASG